MKTRTVVATEEIYIRDMPHDNQGPCSCCHKTFCGALRLTLGHYHDGAAKTVDLCFACALKLKNVMNRVI